MTDYLRIFEAKALAEELTEAGHSVSERTAQRWKAGITKPKPQDLRAIRELVGATVPTTKEAAPPEWAERLEAKVDQLVIGAIADPKQREVVRRLARRLGVLPKPSAEGFDDLPDTGDPDTAVRGGQGSS